MLAYYISWVILSNYVDYFKPKKQITKVSSVVYLIFS